MEIKTTDLYKALLRAINYPNMTHTSIMTGQNGIFQEFSFSHHGTS